ncbi:MAG: coproporphyrinogen III oxidase [Hyphomicrobiales bacterium]|nr:coproporphyrinogen III oxidase [Hyphomicrobiales bacterium]
MLEPVETQSFGIYVHWPFCAAKCPYCDFNSHVRHKPLDQDVFLQAYVRELEYFADLTPGRKVSSIFFGGGTPSLMNVSTVEQILEKIGKHWSIDSQVEITLEANPSSAEAERFKGYREAGVNRVSLGVQSLHDQQLKFLGRLHNVDEARRAITLARTLFERMSFDLIYARPDQTPDDWVNELELALDLTADHLSLYQLTIEQGTRFFKLREKGKLHVPDGELSAELYETTQSVMNARSMPAYEISNHAVNGAESRHNLVYWRYHDYVGVGPGAHGRVTIEGTKIATAGELNPEEWWQNVMVHGDGMVVNDRLTGQEMADEFLVMGLRLAEGISLQRYEAFGASPLNPDNRDFFDKQGFLETLPDGNLRATPKGFLVLDAVVADLVDSVQ